jgi:hypothetical protein
MAQVDAMPRTTITLGGSDMVTDPETLGNQLSSLISQDGEVRRVDLI